MTKRIVLIALLLTGCGENRPPAPTEADNRQLDEAEAMLDEQANEKGPASEPTDPNSNQD